MALPGNASIVRACGAGTRVGGGDYDVIASQTVPAGYCFAITDVQFTVDTNLDIFFLQSPAGVDIASWYPKSELAATPFSFERHYNTPIVIDALAVTTTWKMVATTTAGGTYARASVVGELWDTYHHTARKYGYSLLNAGTPVNLGTAYTVPTGYKLSITDIDVSGIQVGVGAELPYVFQLLIGGVVAYYLELTATGLIMVPLECPLEARSGQAVQMHAFGGANADDLVKGQWTGQLILA